jgi:hypothetical protein
MSVTMYGRHGGRVEVVYQPLQNHCFVAVIESGKLPVCFRARTQAEESQVREALMLVLGAMQ